MKCVALNYGMGVLVGDAILLRNVVIFFFLPTPKRVALFPCIQSQAFILGCYVYIDPWFFFLFGLCFQSLFPDVVPLVHDLALGSTLIIAVNPFLMYMLLLLCLYCHSV